ncbi:hypothetical protein Kpho01_01020 [Kitasatospora phosalacinea]|uniref:Uncharacterized protein n=1 Tax=Kitasatospora phosalacinea TaxID=2065 RepID=A0A9W6UJ73_9ACTN|nr:hypothetical protein Kpho01_01020 [Kitasatospora phosalacinea]
MQVSWITAVPAVVDAPWSLMHNPLRTLTTWNVPDPLATSDHCWLLCPLPHPHCCNCTPLTVEPDGTSTHIPLFTFTNWYTPDETGTNRNC